MSEIIERRPGEIPSFETRGESNETVDRQKRYRQILSILKDHAEPLSAKEVAVVMYRRGYTKNTERNNAAPRLTELCYKGIIEQAGKKKCSYSHKMVTCYKLRVEQ